MPEAPPPSNVVAGNFRQKTSERMRGLMGAAGIEVPDDIALTTPRIDVSRGVPHDLIIGQVSEALRDSKRYGLFRMGDSYGTWEADGKWLPMDKDRLASWLPEVGIVPVVYKGKDEKLAAGNFEEQVCRRMLASDRFRNKIPEIVARHVCPLPVWRKDAAAPGGRRLELLPEGYDAETKVFTCAGRDFDRDMPLEGPDSALSWLLRLLEFFPYGDRDRLGVQVAAMLSAFCRMLYVRCPFFVWTANEPGSGKSMLAKLVLAVVFGKATTTSYTLDQPAEITKTLNTLALNKSSYVFFDDVKSHLVRNEDLNKFVTEPTYGNRVLGGNALFEVENRAIVCMSGQQLKLYDDLAARALMIDLFATLSSEDRVIPQEAVIIDDAFFEDEENLRKTRSALWTLVKYWDVECGRVKGGYHTRFSSWSLVVPGIVKSVAVFGDCLAKFSQPDSGDVEGREWDLLVRAIIAEDPLARRRVVTTKQLVAKARMEELFAEKLWTLEEVLESEGTGVKDAFRPPRDVDPMAKRRLALEHLGPSMKGSWGKRLKSKIANGRHWRVDGQEYQFGKRDNKRAGEYELVKVEAPSAGRR